MIYFYFKFINQFGGAVKTIFTFFSILLFSFTIPAQEDIFYHVIPTDYISIPGTATFLGPLYTSGRTNQLLIHEDQLVDIIGQEIQAISFRLPTSASSDWPAADVTVTNYDIYLSLGVTPADRSLTDFTLNVAGPQKQVRAGSLFIPMNSYTFGNVPNEWGREILFDSLYLYTGGHLLIEIRLTGTGSSRSNDAVGTSTTGYGTQFSACWGSSYTANSGSQANFSIARLTTDDPVPVELTSFTASASASNVLLEWQTASEINNYGFEVERRSVNSEYGVVSFVAGSGTTTEIRNYVFTDDQITDGKYTYRLKQLDFDGSFEYSNEVEIEVISVHAYSLEQNYPNPFNPSTTISFTLPESGNISLKIYNALGENVSTLVSEYKEAGVYSYNFNAEDLPSGTYIYRLNTDTKTLTKKMLFLK